jgi:RNase adapter protein RapZ
VTAQGRKAMKKSHRSPGEFDRVVVTGLSGAGKTVALRALEDLGYFCVDNLPLELLPFLLGLYSKWGRRLAKVAVGVDIRTGLPAGELARSLDRFKKDDPNARVLFFDADNSTILRRFSETRRRHPLSGRVADGIRRERRALKEVKVLADRVIETSRLTPTEAREVVIRMLGLSHPKGMGVTVTSFGYKHGLPLDADLVWDVRFLPNPNWVPALRHLTGRHPTVARYVLGSSSARTFMEKAQDLLAFLLQGYAREGKSYLTIAVGCTGGRHRSVAIAESLGRFMKGLGGTSVRVMHRDAGHGG